MASEGRRIRAQARSISLLIQASSDEEIAKWIAELPPPHPSVEEVRSVRDLLRHVGDAIVPESDASMTEVPTAWKRGPVALAALEGKIGSPSTFSPSPSAPPSPRTLASPPSPSPPPSP